MPKPYTPRYMMGNQTVSGKERELIATVTAYENVKIACVESGQDRAGISVRTKASPGLTEALLMQSERLRSRGLIMSVRGEEVSTKDSDGKLYMQQYGTFQPDGNYQIGCLRKRLQCTTKYRKEQKVLACFTDKDWHHYYIKQEPEEVSKVSSVDRISPLTESLGRIKHYRMMVNLRKEILSFCMSIFLCWIASTMVLGCIWFLLFGARPESLLSPGFIALEVVALLFCLSYIPLFVHRVKSHRVLEKIWQQWPDFCIEKFVSMAGNRLKCMFYADNMEKIGEFISCDLINFLYENDNVVNCETNNLWFESLSEDENYWYVEVCQKVILTRDLEYKMERKKQTVKIRFMRSKDSIMYTDFYRDWYVGEISFGGKKYGDKIG